MTLPPNINGVIIFLGVLLLIISFIWIVILAFIENILWGFASLLIPGVALIFSFLYWDKAKIPFLINTSCIGLAIIRGFIIDA